LNFEWHPNRGARPYSSRVGFLAGAVDSATIVALLRTFRSRPGRDPVRRPTRLIGHPPAVQHPPWPRSPDRRSSNGHLPAAGPEITPRGGPPRPQCAPARGDRVRRHRGPIFVRPILTDAVDPRRFTVDDTRSPPALHERLLPRRRRTRGPSSFGLRPLRTCGSIRRTCPTPTTRAAEFGVVGILGITAALALSSTSRASPCSNTSSTNDRAGSGAVRLPRVTRCSCSRPAARRPLASGRRRATHGPRRRCCASTATARCLPPPSPSHSLRRSADRRGGNSRLATRARFPAARPPRAGPFRPPAAPQSKPGGASWPRLPRVNQRGSDRRAERPRPQREDVTVARPSEHRRNQSPEVDKPQRSERPSVMPRARRNGTQSSKPDSGRSAEFTSAVTPRAKAPPPDPRDRRCGPRGL